MDKVNFFWFRRDLRLNDNAGLYHALRAGSPVIPLFIFDTSILGKLEDKKDPRVEFIHTCLVEINSKLNDAGSSITVISGKPIEIWKKLCNEFKIDSVFTNHDYEPYAIQRDNQVQSFLNSKNIAFNSYKDQVIFEKNEVVKKDGKPYTVFTPYSKSWLEKLKTEPLNFYPSEKYLSAFLKMNPAQIPSLKVTGFIKTGYQFPPKIIHKKIIRDYDKQRDIPGINGTSRLGVHLRFGTLSIRKAVEEAVKLNPAWLNELIWREFYMMIIYHFPNVITKSFKPEYDHIKWRNNEKEFELWCKGKTGYPIVDAGMRELNETGFMHNRVRMITASFLTKHLLIDWRWGEAYFAKKLLDYELSSNNGNWQWAAGTGCDAAPYFRVFNPYIQTEKFDPDNIYIKKWVPEYSSTDYPKPIVEHSFARERAITTYKEGLALVKRQD